MTPILARDAYRTRPGVWTLALALALLLHAGASPTRPGKRWPHFAALAARLRAAGFTLAWLGAEAEPAQLFLVEH